MHKKMKLSVVISIGLGMGLLFNHSVASVADEATPVPAPAKTEVPAPPAKKIPPEMLLLKDTVGKYVEAWQNRDFKTMHSFENWEGGKELDEIAYIQSFDADFAIHQWKITRIGKADKDQYQVLVWVVHNMSKDMPTIVPRKNNQKLRSTLVQWWKKEGDKFVHLFHIENQKLIDSLPPSPPMQSPIPSMPSSPAPKTEGEHQHQH